MSTREREIEARQLYKLVRKADGAAAVSLIAAALADAFDRGRTVGQYDERGKHAGACVHPDTLDRITMLERAVFGGATPPRKEGDECKG